MSDLHFVMLYVLIINIGLLSSPVLCASKNSKVYDLVYEDIDEIYYDSCVRLMNGTSQIGCQSSLEGDVGVLFHVNESSLIGKVVQGKHPPYIVLLPAELFTKTTVSVLRSSGKVTGITVYSADDYSGPTSGWSPDLKCPRYRYGLYSESYGRQYAECRNEWNPLGDGLTEEDIPFPIFVLRNYTWATVMIDCHDTHNLDREYPLCAAQMKSRMDGAQSTETCVRRNNLQNNLSPASYCGEIGGRTVMASLQSTNSSSPENISNILVTAALDSRSLELSFVAPGANSATGFITLLATAQAIAKLTSEEKNEMKKNVIFMLFDGEAFDNMGSSRMVYDMSKNEFPFKPDEKKWQPMNFDLSTISHIIEFGQVGLGHSQAWIHYDPLSLQDPNVLSGVGDIVNALKSSAPDTVEFKNQSSGIGLVPSSLQSVLVKANISGVVLTDFDKSYQNKYYFSRYDTLDKLGIVPDDNATETDNLIKFMNLASRLSNISTAAARSIYKLATGKANDKIVADADTISRLLYCFLYKVECSLFTEIKEVGTSYSTDKDKAYNRYVREYKDSFSKVAAYFARNVLAYFLGEKTEGNSTDNCKAEDAKDEINEYFLFQGSMANTSSYVCFRANVYDMDGRSPASVIENYDYAGGDYGAWSESRWSKNAFRFRFFLVQDETTQGLTLLSGLLMLLSSLTIVYIVNKKADILFANESL